VRNSFNIIKVRDHFVSPVMTVPIIQSLRSFHTTKHAPGTN